MNDTPNSVDQASTYIRKGWAPVPIAAGNKHPNRSSWQTMRFDGPDDERLVEAFTGQGVGLILGEPSSHLVDVDLDSPEAVSWASIPVPGTSDDYATFLPITELIGGRENRPRSHFFYLSEDAEPIKLSDPAETDRKRRTIIELRAGGKQQTLVYPSRHDKEGDQYQWDSFGEPLDIEERELTLQVHELAALSLILKYWPAEGSRHDAYRALCGALLRDRKSPNNIDPHWAERIPDIVAAIALMTDDEEVESRMQNIRTTMSRLKKDERTDGFPTLKRLAEESHPDCGIAISKAAEWIGMRRDERDGSLNNLDDLFDAILDAEEEDEYDDEFMPRTDIWTIIENGVPEFEELIPGFLFKNQVHILLGYPGCGKSLLCLWAAKKIINDHGMDIAFIDQQNGEQIIADRCQKFGFTKEELDKFHYYDHTHPQLVEDYEKVLAEFKSRNVGLVILDSMSDFISLEADGSEYQSENSNTFVGQFFRESLDKWIKQEDLTVLVIDHLSKSDHTRARGAIIKEDLTQFMYTTKVDKKWNAHKDGKLTLTKAKARLLNVPDKLRFDIYPTRTPEEIHYVPQWDSDDDGGQDHAAAVKVDDLVKVAGRVANTLFAQGDWMTGSLIVDGTELPKSQVYAFLKTVRDSGHPTIECREKSPNKFEYRFKEEAND